MVEKKTSCHPGERYGRLVITRRAPDLPSGHVRWYCDCDCGTKDHIVIGWNLKSGKTKSCGCLKKESDGKQRVTHGKTGTSLYNVWRNMRRRCDSPHRKDYKRYGERGIVVCDEWNNSFELFYEWAISNGYKDNLQIDRINNDGNYEPNNCRWVTAEENSNNKECTAFVEFNNEKLTLKELSVKYAPNISASVLYNRIFTRHWDIEKAINTPLMQGGHKIKHKPILQIKDGFIINEYPSLVDASRSTGIEKSNIRAVCNHRHGCLTAGGYIWKWRDEYYDRVV